jgi:hypothetical protein
MAGTRPRANPIKHFKVIIYNRFRNKLECLSLASLCNIVYLWIRPGAYPKVELLKGAILEQAPALPTNKHKTRLQRLGRDKHSSLLRKSVNYVRKIFIGLAPRLINYNNDFLHLFLLLHLVLLKIEF